MSNNITVLVSHTLGKAEAERRLREGLARADGALGAMISVEQATWQGDVLSLRLRTLGQSASATIEVLESALRIEMALPWLLAKAANRLLPVLRKEATRLLERK